MNVLPKVAIANSTTDMGRVIAETLAINGFSVVPLPEERSTWAQWLADQNPFCVLNNAGFGLPVESMPDKVSVLAPGRLHAKSLLEAAEALGADCALNNRFLLQLSSYRVFPGEKSGYTQDDTPQPRDLRGQQCLEAEAFARQVQKHMILRLGWLISASGRNLMTRIASPLARGELAEIHSERRGGPVGYQDVADIIVAILKQVLYGASNWGIFHYSSSDVCTEAELADEILRHLQESGLGELASKEEVSPVSEPLSADLGYQRLMDDFGVQPKSWRVILTREMSRWIERGA